MRSLLRSVSDCGRLLLFVSILINLLSVLNVSADATQTELIEFNIPVQPLSEALQSFARQSDMQILYSADLVQDLLSVSLVGSYTREQALQKMLIDSGLKFRFIDENTVTLLSESAMLNEVEKQLEPLTVEGRQQIINAGPMPGLNLSLDQIPGNVQRATGEEIKESRALNIAEFMRMNMQSINVNDVQGNPYQMDVNYRGFTASPQFGTPQGLSVFFDGIRVNEPFGDVVNWDLIPTNAIATFDIVPGSNPLYGLNTLGGALNIRTKNGFDNPGIESTVTAGSWDRKHGEFSAGGSYGKVAGFMALTGFKEDGWRDNSPSEVRQGFGKITVRDHLFEVNATVTLVGNDLIGNGMIPQQMFNERPESIFTSPDSTKNNLRQFNFDGVFNVNNKFNITAQAYRRAATRRGFNGDVFGDFEDLNTPQDRVYMGTTGDNTEDFSGLFIPGLGVVTQPVCRFSDVNSDGLIDYSVDLNADGVFDPNEGFNTPLEEAYEQVLIASGNTPATLSFDTFLGKDVPVGQIRPEFIRDVPINTPTSIYPDDTLDFPQFSGNPADFLAFLTAVDAYVRNRCVVPQVLLGTNPRNGSSNGTSGIVEGTPIAVITETNIDQISNGGAINFNFNLDKHAFMVGAAAEQSTANYNSTQQLALMDASRNVFLAPNEIDPFYFAAMNSVQINNFEGSTSTMSAYFNETFSPNDKLHLTAAGRYNYTKVKNNLGVRPRPASSLAGLRDFSAGRPNVFLCSTQDPASCPDEVNADIDQARAFTPAGADRPFVQDGDLLLSEPPDEEYTFHKFNPSFGINFLPNDNINLYASWNQGTRAPSSIELGCAFDPTPVTNPRDEDGPLIPASFVDRAGGCTLPNALSGDPFLPQIVSRTTELGFRIDLPNGWEWNFAAYKSNLFDDTYLVDINGLQFFDTVGRTRRQGIETGFSGSIGKLDFNLSYGMNEATFQSTFWLTGGERRVGTLAGTTVAGSVFNSSTDLQLFRGTGFTNRGFNTFGLYQIDPGDRIPGMPLHNLNASFNYHATPQWDIGLNITAHTFSYARGNENNDHRVGANDANTLVDGTINVTDRTRTYTNSGIIPGYALFNMHTSYRVDNKLMVFAQINNIFDNKYASAGRLGVNPFSPSTVGAIGESGFNYNSDEWQYDTFIAPGSPRAVWFGLEYSLDGQPFGKYASSGTVDGNFYLGGSLGRAEAVGACDSLDSVSFVGKCEDTDLAWKLFGGYRITKHFGIEAFYADLGRYLAEGTIQGVTVPVSTKTKVDSFGLSATINVELANKFEVFGKVGFHLWEVSSDANAASLASISVDDTGIDPLVGAGIQYVMNDRFSVRAEWERLLGAGNAASTGESDMDLISAGIVFSF